MKLDINKLDSHSAKVISDTYGAFSICCLLLGTVGGFSLGAACGHFEHLWLEGALILGVSVGFIFSLIFFTKVHKQILARSKEG